MSAGRPIGRPSDPGLSNLFDAINSGRQREITPDLAPKLRAITLGSLKELRKTRGDQTGNRGPAACILAGNTETRDGGEGVFLWHPTLTTPDNGGQGSAGVVAVAGVETGRWIKAQLYPTVVPPVPARTLISRQTTAPSSWTAVTVAGDAADTLGFEIVGTTDATPATIRLRFCGSAAAYDYTDIHQNAIASTLVALPTVADTGVTFKADGAFSIWIPISDSGISTRRFRIESAEYNAGGGPGGSDRDLVHLINGRCTTGGQITSIEVAVTAGSPAVGSLSIFKTARNPG